MHGPDGVDQFRLALNLVNLDTRLKIDLTSLYSGVPIFEDDVFKKKYNEKVLFELKRLKEEF